MQLGFYVQDEFKAMDRVGAKSAALHDFDMQQHRDNDADSQGAICAPKALHRIIERG